MAIRSVLLPSLYIWLRLWGWLCGVNVMHGMRHVEANLISGGGFRTSNNVFIERTGEMRNT